MSAGGGGGGGSGGCGGSGGATGSSQYYYEYDLINSNFLQHGIIPWVPASAIFIHCCLLLEGLDLAGLPFAFWLSTGN